MSLGVEMKNLRLVIGILVFLILVCSPVAAISKADLLASYRTIDRFPVWKDSTTDIPPIEVLSSENPYHFGESIYCDSKGNILINGLYGLWGKTDLPYIKPKWGGG